MKRVIPKDQRAADRHKKMRDLLTTHNCHRIAEFAGPETTDPCHMELWGVPHRGTLILQFWSEGGVSTYADWPTGVTWEELETFLSQPKQT